MNDQDFDKKVKNFLKKNGISLCVLSKALKDCHAIDRQTLLEKLSKIENSLPHMRGGVSVNRQCRP